MNLCLNCLAASDEISRTATLQPAFTALRKNAWVKKRPGMVIFCLLGCDSASILKRMVPSSAVFSPAASKMALIISQVDDLPLVPVTAMTVSEREGKRYMRALVNAKR